MRVEGTCRSPNGGGWVFFVGGSPYSTGLSLLPAFQSPAASHRGKFSAKQGKNEFLFGVSWCFLGIFGDKKVQNLNIFLKVRKENRCGGGRLAAFHGVHWEGFEGLPWLLVSCGGVFRPFVLPFVPLLLFLSCNTC